MTFQMGSQQSKTIAQDISSLVTRQESGTFGPALLFVDGSASMNANVGRSFYRDMGGWIMSSKNKHVQVSLFGSRSDGPAYDNHIDELRGLKTPQEFKELGEKHVFDEFVKTYTYAYDIQRALDIEASVPNREKKTIVIVGDGGFNDAQNVVNAISQHSDLISAVHILVVPDTACDICKTLSKTFADGLHATSVTVSVKFFTATGLKSALETSSMPAQLAGFSQPVFAGECWLSFNNDKLLATSDQELRASLRGAPPEDQQHLLEAVTHAALGLTHAGQINRLQQNKSLQNVWRMTKAIHNVTGQLADVMNRVTTAGSLNPELKELMRSSNTTNVNINFNTWLLDFVQKDPTDQEYLVIPPEPLVDSAMMQNPVPTNVDLAAIVIAFKKAKTVKSEAVFSKGANPSANRPDEASTKYVPLLSLNHLPADTTDVATQQTIQDYVSLLLSAVAGTTEKRISGFLLLRWVLLILSSGDQGPLQVDKNPTWKKLKTVFLYYVEHAHGVNLQPARMSESILNMLGHKTTFALFAFGCKTFPTMCPTEFSELLKQVALGQTLRCMVRSQKIRKHLAAHSSPAICWKQWDRVKAWLKGDDELKAAFRQFQGESHDVGTPVSGSRVRQWLAQGLLDEKDRKLFLFYLDVFCGNQVEVNMLALAKTDDENKEVALSSKECGFCCIPCSDVKNHVKDMVKFTKQKHFKAFVPCMHDRSNQEGNFYCVACKETFPNISQRTTHLKSTTGTCRRGQTENMRKAHLVSVSGFVKVLWKLTKKLIESEAQEHNATLTFEMIKDIHSQPTEYVSTQELASQDEVIRSLGKVVVRALETGGKLTVFQVCSTVEEKEDAEFPEADSSGLPSSSQPQKQEQEESSDEKKNQAVEMDPVYLEKVLATAQRQTTDRINNEVNSLKSLNTCFACMEKVAGAGPLQCGHALCGPCLHNLCQVVEEQGGTQVLTRIPRCWCGIVLPLHNVSSHCVEYGRCAKQLGPKFTQLHTTAVLGICTKCNQWTALRARGGACGAAGEAEPAVHTPICGQCMKHQSEAIETYGEDIPRSHQSDCNPLCPTTCKGCGKKYVHQDEYGNPNCSHSTCPCGHEQCKVCGMTFVDSQGNFKNDYHNSYVTEQIVDGKTVWWYPSECHTGV